MGYMQSLWSNWDKHTEIHQIEKVISHSTFYAINNFWYYQLSNFVSIQTGLFFSLSFSFPSFVKPQPAQSLAWRYDEWKTFPKTYHINPVEFKNEFHWDIQKNRQRDRYIYGLDGETVEWQLVWFSLFEIWIKLNTKWKVFTVGHISKFCHLCNRCII